MGIAVSIMLIRFIHAFVKQKAQYTIASILFLTLGVAIFSKIYASAGNGWLIYYFSATYAYIVILWYWKTRIE
jgi:hypothetical protein